MNTMRNALLLALVLVLCNLHVAAEQGYSRQEAQKVLKLIDKIERDQTESGEFKKRKVEVSESEFNAYIAHRIETENEQAMKALELKLFEENRIEGKLYFDLRGQNLPKILRPEMNFYFSGIIETNNGAVRLNLDELFLEGQEIQPVLLDLVFMIVAKINKVESSSINDWYLLPYGIKEIKVFKGRAEFYY